MIIFYHHFFPYITYNNNNSIGGVMPPMVSVLASSVVDRGLSQAPVGSNQRLYKRLVFASTHTALSSLRLCFVIVVVSEQFFSHIIVRRSHDQ
jgi:hypothetical protein